MDLIFEDRRKHVRKAFLTVADYSLRGRKRKDLIENISVGGVLIQTCTAVAVGEPISMVFPLPSYVKTVKISGEVVRVAANAIGVKFKSIEPVSADSHVGGLKTSQPYFHNDARKPKKVLKARKKRVRWSASAASEVSGYKLYWAAGEGVNYDSDSAEVGNVTEVVLPDDFPSFPLVAGQIELGVTAVSYSGNESDMTKFTVSFDFIAQDAQWI